MVSGVQSGQLVDSVWLVLGSAWSLSGQWWSLVGQ